DYRMGNLIVDGSGLAAVLDWELVHIGEAFEDLAWFCIRAWRFGAPAVLGAGGLGTIESFLRAYEEAGGVGVDRVAFHWWLVLATLRWGVICRYQAERHLSGQTRSVELATIGRRVCETEWDLLNLLAEAGQAEPTYTLRLCHEVTGLLRSGAGISGVTYTSPDGDGELRADLTVACDGRTSIVRQSAGLVARDFPVPFDVWWFRLPRDSSAEYTLIPRITAGRMLIMIPREGYFQLAYLIPKGSDPQLRARGLDALKAELAELVPEADTDTLTSFDQVKFLDVRLNRLSRWHTDGLLCLGDAAHAMSPVGGVGINMAIQDAVGAATLLAGPLRRGAVTDRDLAAVRKRRLPPAAVTQAVQRILHKRLVAPILNGDNADPPAAVTALIRRLPGLSVIPAYLVGVGVRPEHAPEFARR
ncbi:MAG: FAD-dependent monooxygenase, partial [Mycolicibacterium aromaticivorans]|nr:FAD-dependent monooxygenase [Mycolicibacterium aromaticivorans]